MAALLVTLFSLKLHLLPVALLEGPEYFILPVLTLSLAPTAYITRITRSALLETLALDHIRTALAKGLSNREVLIRHALRNSLLPILTVVGPLTAVLITGSFVVEYVFAIPGMGKYFVTAFINRDYFLVSGVVLVFALILLIINMLVELSFPLLDPKLKS
jgi:oligopeptide transport system permease protein